MSKLTGAKDTDFLVLMELNDSELGKVCKANKYVNSLCNDPQFWANRIVKFFPLSGEDIKKLKEYLDIRNNKDLYLYLRSIRTIQRFKGKIYDMSDIFKTVVLRYLVKQTVPEQIINAYLRDDLPKWFNRQEVIYEMRRRFPEAVLKEAFSKGEKKAYGTMMTMNMFDFTSDDKQQFFDNVLLFPQ